MHNAGVYLNAVSGKHSHALCSRLLTSKDILNVGHASICIFSNSIFRFRLNLVYLYYKIILCIYKYIYIYVCVCVYVCV